MPQIINTNVASLNAQRNLNTSQSALAVSLQRLSSGLRINSAKDDAAGLAISERMTTQIKGLNQAVRNANDGVSLAQTAEGALSQSGQLLQRMRELAIQSANSTNSASDRSAIQSEVNQIKDELNRVASTTTFNGLKILDGSFQNQGFQVGANANQTIGVSIAGVAATDLANYSVSGVSTSANQGTGQAAAAAAALPGANVIAAQTLTISGAKGTSTVAVTAGNSAYTVATNVNAASGTTGVTAKANNEATIAGLSAAGTVTLTLGSGSSTSTISAAVSTTDLSALAKAINNVTGTTGITAEATGGSLKLKQADGKDINIANFDHSTASATATVTGLGADAVTLTQGAADSTVVAGSVTFSSSDTYSVSSSVANTAGSIVDVAASTSVASTANLVSAIDVGTIAGAQSAIDVLDSALAKVSGVRGDLGAVQTRFELAITNLQTTSENLSAARSRIQDADFAAETAQLTRAQILQQAGTAMLAQANALPNSVLTLLRG
ncbi:flagellin [Betaproteobacteria bacterium GR16-43]|nr:flagellin [Betaproteobacteria bacterium GR16-43]